MGGYLHVATASSDRDFLRMCSVAVLVALFLLVVVSGKPVPQAFKTREQQERFLRAKGFDRCQDYGSDQMDAMTGYSNVKETKKQGKEGEEEEDDDDFRGDYIGCGDEMDAVTFMNALRCFQKSVGLPQTGVADEKTIRAMQDSAGYMDQELYKGGTRKKRFALVRQRWNRNYLTFYIQNYNVNRKLSQMTNVQIRQRIKEAIKWWTDVANLTVTELNSTNADIVIGFYSGNHHCPGGQVFYFMRGLLAHAFPPGPGYLGDIHINADEPFRYEASKPGKSFLYTFAHEFGHALSFAHSVIRKAVMFSKYPRYSVPTKLDPDDIEACQTVYGKKK